MFKLDLEPISQIGNGCVAGDLALEQGARRENILYGSLTNEQRRSSGKDPQPCGLSSGEPLAALLLSHRAPLAMLLRRALPAARQNLAHSFPIYEMGSKPASGQQRCQSSRTRAKLVSYPPSLPRLRRDELADRLTNKTLRRGTKVLWLRSAVLIK